MKKKVLITGGATWIKIDEVRVLTNIFTGKTALEIVCDFKKRGWDVTLLINPHCIDHFPRQITRHSFRYFSELKKKLESLLSKNRYDIIVHSAAVSDYQLTRPLKGKFPSKRRNVTLKLTPTEKLIHLIRKRAKKSFLVQFKLEYDSKALKQKAMKSLNQNASDLIVANAYTDIKRAYKAWVLDPCGKGVQITSKKSLVPAIFKFYNDRNA